MHSDCPECQRLWQEYAVAIRTHIRLEYKLRGTAMEGELEQIQAIAEDADRADLAGANFREAIRNHDEKVHREGGVERPSVFDMMNVPLVRRIIPQS